MFTANDHALMARAVRLAERGRFWARPNPHVGCVLVRDGVVVGEGFTQPAGGAHAEVMALNAAGETASGSTAYVTLEPCGHFGKTPPCAHALVKAGVVRVVAGLQDPNPRVDGGGFAYLQEHGVAVAHGLLAAAVEEQLAGFLARQRRGKGRVRIKLAMSLDGRTAMASGDSQWITGPAARRDVQRLRAASCAIITGVGTVLADDCALTVREDELPGCLLPEASRRALRVVLDSKLRTPATSRVLAGPQPKLLVHRAGVESPKALEDVPKIPVPSNDDGIDLAELLEALSQRECNEILVESGPSVAGAFLRQGLADELVVYLAPKLLGSRARPLFDLPLDRMADSLALKLVEQRQVGGDLRLRFHPTEHADPKDPD